MRSLKSLLFRANERLPPVALGFFLAIFRRNLPKPVFSEITSALVLKLDEIGDFVLITPFLRELRRNAPRAKITLVVKPLVYNLAETCPYVNQVLVYDWARASRRPVFSVWSHHWRAFQFSWEHLRHSRFQVALIPRLDVDTYDATTIAVYSRARTRVAFSEKSSFLKSFYNRDFDRLMTNVISLGNRPPHEARASLSLLEAMGASISSQDPELWISREDEDFARDNLASGPNYVALATGASKPEKCWPESAFSELADWLIKSRGFAPVLLGIGSDACLPNVIDFRGQTTLRQSAALMDKCVLFIGNDSGLKHVAAARKIPVVEINTLRMGLDSAHTNHPARFGAWQVAQRVVQPPPGPGDFAIHEVSLASVQSAIDSLLRDLGLLKENAL